MATHLGTTSSDGRRTMPSPRPKGRENAKHVLCRNIGIYGHCRYEHEGCPFNHDVATFQRHDSAITNPIAVKQNQFSADSPAFTPALPALNGGGIPQPPRPTTISPKAANAAPFTPKTNKAMLAPSAITFQPKEVLQDHTAEYAPHTSHEFQEFIPHSYNSSNALNQHDQNAAVAAATAAAAAAAGLLGYSDPFSAASSFGVNSHPTSTGSQASQANPYASDHSAMHNAAYYSNNGGFAQPAQYHLYAPIGVHRDKLQGYQRLVYDLFVPQDLREEVQRRSEAALRSLPSSHLPAAIEHYHSLYPLDTSNTKNTSTFGYPTWIYRATSAEDGKLYALRRIEGFRLTSENAIRTIKKWKQVLSSGLVTIHDAFTTREFHDSSLILVTDYWPSAKTMTEQYANFSSRQQIGRAPNNFVREDVLWAFIVQIATTLKAIHSNGLAAQIINPSKILITSKNRIRLNGCGLLDIIRFDSPRPLSESQQEDFVQFGRLILSIASGSVGTALNVERALQNLTRQTYTKTLRDAIQWLLTSPTASSGPKDIDAFLREISAQTARVLDSTFLSEDHLYGNLSSEIENGRLFRLISKLGLINERPEFEHNPQWSETGDRYYLKLFRDYVFHQVDENGQPIADLSHVVSCLNKLDAGSEETVRLMSRDEQHVLFVSYKELKRGVESAFNELTKNQRR